MDNDFNTPYFVIHKDKLDVGLDKMKRDAAKFFIGGFVIGYSYKTNSLPWVIKYFRDNGCYAEVVSDDEYNLGKHIGVERNKYIYNGIIKSKTTFLEALNNGCIVNIDSKREIEWLDDLERGKTYNIGIRANFDIENVCPGESQCGDEGGRFGFCYENGELEKAINQIRCLGFDVSCLHLHCSSKTRSLNIYRAISKYACSIAKKYNLKLDFIDVGGGFFGGLDNKPQFDEYFELISKTLSEFFDLSKIKVVVEPGMSLIGSCISYVTRVIDVKNTIFNRFVVIDGSRIHIDPLMTKTSYFYDYKSNCDDHISKQVICGFTCMENDRLMIIKDGKALSVGDEIVFNNVGAYTMCLSPLFIKYYPKVFVSDDNKMMMIRDKWGPKEYCSKGE